jgi:hypothetical protein
LADRSDIEGKADLLVELPDFSVWTQSGRRKRVAFVSERDSLASRCEA